MTACVFVCVFVLIAFLGNEKKTISPVFVFLFRTVIKANNKFVLLFYNLDFQYSKQRLK